MKRKKENQVAVVAWNAFTSLQLVYQLCLFLESVRSHQSDPNLSHTWTGWLQCTLLGATLEKCSEAAPSAEYCRQLVAVIIHVLY